MSCSKEKTNDPDIDQSGELTHILPPKLIDQLGIVKAKAPYEMGYAFTSKSDGQITQFGLMMPQAGDYKISVWDAELDTLIYQSNLKLRQNKSSLIYEDIKPITIYKGIQYMISVSVDTDYTEYYKRDSLTLPIESDDFVIEFCAFSTEPGQVPNKFRNDCLSGYPDFTFIKSKAPLNADRKIHFENVPSNIIAESCDDFVKKIKENLTNIKDKDGKDIVYSDENGTVTPGAVTKRYYKFKPISGTFRPTTMYWCKCKDRDQWHPSINECMEKCEATIKCLESYCKETKDVYYKIPLKVRFSIDNKVYNLDWDSNGKSNKCKEAKKEYLDKLLEHEMRHIQAGDEIVKKYNAKYSREVEYITADSAEELKRKQLEFSQKIVSDMEAELIPIDKAIDEDLRKNPINMDCSKCQ